MAPFLVLDSEAVSALVDTQHRGAAARRAQAVLVEAARRNALIRIPSAVLAEVYRGTRRDAAVDRVVGRGNRLVPLDHGIARTVGALLSRDRLDSCHTVDAYVVATAIRLGGAVVATGHPDDLKSLARDHRNAVVQSLA